MAPPPAVASPGEPDAVADGGAQRLACRRVAGIGDRVGAARERIGPPASEPPGDDRVPGARAEGRHEALGRKIDGGPLAGFAQTARMVPAERRNGEVAAVRPEVDARDRAGWANVEEIERVEIAPLRPIDP